MAWTPEQRSARPLAVADEFEISAEQLEKLKELHRLMRGAANLKKYNRFAQFNPYPKQQTFFRLGPVKGQRMFNAGNRLGKTEAGAFETACHLTGRYPDWWQGYRFSHPVEAWAVGLSAEATRDIVQEKLCGRPMVAGSLGTGMIPLDMFAAAPTMSRGKSGAFDTIQIKHHGLDGKEDGISVLTFKSCEQGWEKFQGTAKDWVWIDEEPDDYKVYTECITRTLDTGGKLIVTYTPLSGETSDLWQAFQNPADTAKGIVSMSLDEVLSYPGSHIDETKAAEMMMSWPAHERQTRASGAPSVGAGAVFAFMRQQIECPPIHDPGGYVKLGWGIDFGGMGGTTLQYSHPFGAVLMAYDPASDTIYIIREVRLPGGMILQHCDAMKRICELAPVFWPHDGHRTSNEDKTKDTRDLYKSGGLKMWHTHATLDGNPKGGYSTEAGILQMQGRFETGRLRVCANLPMWWGEFGSYSRDEHGDIVKVNDDLMSATRQGTMMVPKFGLQVPMGSFAQNFRSSRSGFGGPPVRMSTGLNEDPWNPTSGGVDDPWG